MARRTGEQPSEDAVYGAMEKAMQARGLRTARALAQALNAANYKVSERAVSAWRNRESSIPGWALPAFREISGLSLDSLLGLPATDSAAQSVAGQERALAELRERVETLDTELAEMGTLLGQVIGVLENEGISLSAASSEGTRAERAGGGRRAVGER